MARAKSADPGKRFDVFENQKNDDTANDGNGYIPDKTDRCPSVWTALLSFSADGTAYHADNGLR